MLTLLDEVHFWTLKDDTNIRNTDFGAFRYYDKKSSDDSPFSDGKKTYAEKRGLVWVPQNKRPNRLKDNLKELEECLLQQRLVLCQWRDSSLVQLMFSSGLFVSIHVNVFTGDPTNITFDKFLVGKLLSDYIADVVLTKSHLVCSYNDNQLTLVYFTKPALKRSAPKSISRLEPRIHTVDLAGPAGRRLEKKLACNVSGDMIVVWWHCSRDEVYPWSPVVKDQDRANILVYGISGTKAELLCHHRSEFDLISISFNQVHSNIIHSVEQKVSRKGEVTVESCTYQVGRARLQRSSLISIPLPTHVCCHGFSPDQDKLLLGCIDGSLVLYDEGRGVTHIVKAAFIPTLVSWHPDGAVVLVANERCQLQLLDAALASLKQQVLSEDVTPAILLDLASYFRAQPTLMKLKWNKKPETLFYGEKYAASDNLLLLLFERGPLGTLRLIGSGGLTGDIHGSGGLSFDSLVAQYLWVNQVDRAINLLLTLNWDVSGNTCLSCLHRIANHLFRQPLSPDREVQLQTALGSFHVPLRPMCPATSEEFSPAVRDLTRRFFHHLLRYKLFEKAFRLAIDLQDRDLFMDIHFSARNAGESEIADAAYSKAEDLESSTSGSSVTESSHSVCSRSSCSECLDTASVVSSEEDINSHYSETHQSHSRHSHARGSRRSVRRHRPVGNSESDTNSSSAPTAAASPSTQIFTAPPPLPVITSTLCSKIVMDDRRKPYFHENRNGIDLSVSSPYLLPSSSMGNPSLNQLAHLGVGRSLNNISGSVDSAGIFDISGSVRSFHVESKVDAGNANGQHHGAPEIEKPKVKFCETITQIPLPERLHPLMEEEEELPPYKLLPDPTQQSSPPSLTSPGFAHIKPYPRSLLSHSQNKPVFDRSLPVVPRVSQPINHGSSSMTSSLPSFGMSSNYNPQNGVSQCGNQKQSKDFLIGVRKGSSLDLNRNFEALELEQPDSLGTEELSALLPGSRKPVSSSALLPKARLEPSNRNCIKSSIENQYLMNYANAINDLSEEEENNGSIKIVHFGVV